MLAQLASTKSVPQGDTKAIRKTVESFLHPDKLKLFKKLCALEDADDISDSLVKKVIAAVYNLEDGGVLALPTGFFDQNRNRLNMLWLIRREPAVGKGEPTYQLTLVVTGPGESRVIPCVLCGC